MTSGNRLVEGICNFVVGHILLIIGHRSVKFDSHRLRENKFIAFLICFVTLYDHVMNRLCDFVDNRAALEPTILSSLVAICLDHLITCSKRQKTP